MHGTEPASGLETPPYSVRMTFAHDERLALCDDALAAGPSAPTLCEGWTVADLVAHLYVRENDPAASVGLFLPPLSDLPERRMAGALAKYGFEGLVGLVRQGPRPWSPFRVPGVDAKANALEMFVHHEDIRRAGDPVPPPRPLGRSVEDEIWKGFGLARLMLRRSPVGVVLERADAPGTELRVRAGSHTVTVVGRPSEIALYLFGRTQVADVELIGEPGPVSEFRRVKLSV